MKFKHIIGIDISKLTIDVCLLKEGVQAAHHAFDNDEAGFKAMSKWLTSQRVVLGKSLFGMEHTGCYGDPLREWLNRKGYALALESGFEVSRASASIRGKTDRIDAMKIGRYFYLRQQEVELDKPRQACLKRLKALHGYRRRLVKSKAAMQASQGELSVFQPEEHAGALAESSKRVLDTMEEEIAAVEKLIRELIQEHAELQRNYSLATSVVGVNMVTAVALLLITENFTRIDSPKKLACYIGIAPFPKQSGSSIRGRPRVSHIGDQQTKGVLSMAANSAVAHDPQIRSFYQRKIEQGKPGNVALNAVMNKIVHRVCAVVKRGEPYTVLGKHAA